MTLSAGHSLGRLDLETTWVLWLIAAATLVRIGFGWALGLGVDESYMVAAGRSLRLGYFDHPPASWWMQWAAAHPFGTDAPLAVRAPFILAFALTTWLMYRLGTAVAGRRSGLWAAVALNLSPVFGVTTASWVLPDGPLDCALLGAALCLMKVLSIATIATRSAAGGATLTRFASRAALSRYAGESLRAPAAACTLVDEGAPVRGAGPHPVRFANRPLPQAGEVKQGRRQRLVVPRGSVRSSWQVWVWWLACGLCAGLALLSKYTAVLTIAGAVLFLLTSARHRHWLARPHPFVAGLLALALFSPVVWWNATHGWASFAFQGERAGGLRFHPGQPFVVLAGEALFVLPWIWAPMMLAAIAALRRGPADWRSWLLCCLGAPPIVLFALISAWSSQRVLFHWAAPGYLMLFPLLGRAIAERTGAPWARRALVGTAALVLIAVIVIGTEVRLGWLRPVIAAVAGQDPDVEAIDWTSLRKQLAARGLLQPGVIVGVPNWRDAGKIGYALGPGVTVTVLNGDARQFGLVAPAGAYAGRTLLVLTLDDIGRARREVSPWFTGLEQLPAASIDNNDVPLQTVSVFLGRGLRIPPHPG